MNNGIKPVKLPNKDKERIHKKKDNPESMNDIAAWYVKSEVVSKQNANHNKDKEDQMEATVNYREESAERSAKPMNLDSERAKQMLIGESSPTKNGKASIDDS